LNRPTLTAGERIEEKSPNADWKLESAVVFDTSEITEKFFCILGPAKLTDDLDAPT